MKIHKVEEKKHVQKPCFWFVDGIFMYHLHISWVVFILYIDGSTFSLASHNGIVCVFASDKLWCNPSLIKSRKHHLAVRLVITPTHPIFIPQHPEATVTNYFEDSFLVKVISETVEFREPVKRWYKLISLVKDIFYLLHRSESEFVTFVVHFNITFEMQIFHFPT